MDRAILDADEILQHASPVVHQSAHEVQPYGHLIRMPIALAESACKEGVENLNQLLADSMTLRDLYKKHHWHVSGPTFYQLHLLFDKHCAEQTKLIALIGQWALGQAWSDLQSWRMVDEIGRASCRERVYGTV